MQFIPVSATETLIREIAYAQPDDRRETRAARYLNWRINRQVNAEDTVLIERVQAGMASSSYVSGPLSPAEPVPGRLRRADARARSRKPPWRPSAGMTQQSDVVIIGGGHNGLVCAFYLASAGLKVTVLERRGVVGGAAVTEEFHPGLPQLHRQLHGQPA